MKITQLMIAAFSLLFVTACGHRTDYKVTDQGILEENIGYSSACEELEKIGDKVYFAFDSSSLSHEAKETLDRQAEFLKSHPDLTIRVEGNCDERGTREYNMALGERRAFAAVNYLISKGINSDRITAISYGKERPAVLGHDEAAWSLNRRSVTVIR